MRHIALLGSTGSIGTSTLAVIDAHRDQFKLITLVGGENIPLLIEQINCFSPQLVAVKRPEDAEQLKNRFPHIKIYSGPEGLLEAVSYPTVDTMVSAIDGTTALEATLISIGLGHRICLANKETLVAAGELIYRTLQDSSAEIIPIDSEQSAIFQALGTHPGKQEFVKHVILTASGGPFFKIEKEEFRQVTIQQALNHPTWSMGTKVTVDSATLMNKALEVVEAFYLFQLRPDQVEVVIHPQSIVHSMVEFVDTSILAQLSMPDMKVPILYSLSYPSRVPIDVEPLSFANMLKLEFYPVDREKFTSIPIAFDVLHQGKNAGAVLNAANEIAVQYFLKEKIAFSDIFSVVEHIYYNERFYPLNHIDDVRNAIDEIKKKTEIYINEKMVK